jgi:hypothetical protein
VRVVQDAESTIESGISQHKTDRTSAQIREPFVRAHAQCQCDRNGQLVVLADPVGRITNDAQLKMVSFLTYEIIAPLHLLCRQVEIGSSGTGDIP